MRCAEVPGCVFRSHTGRAGGAPIAAQAGNGLIHVEVRRKPRKRRGLTGSDRHSDAATRGNPGARHERRARTAGGCCQYDDGIIESNDYRVVAEMPRAWGSATAGGRWSAGCVTVVRWHVATRLAKGDYDE